MLLLHLGCGDVKKDGFVNIDIVKTPATDLITDLSKPLPYQLNSVDEIYNHHLLEHFEYPVIVLSDWYRVLKPGGKLEIHTPDMDGICREWSGAFDDYRRHLVKMALGNSGGFMRHQCLFWPAEIDRVLVSVGFIDIEVECLSECGGPSMKVVCFKP